CPPATAAQPHCPSAPYSLSHYSLLPSVSLSLNHQEEPHMRAIHVPIVGVLVWICVLGWSQVEAAAPAATHADGPPQRSTRFDLTGRISYPSDVRFNRNAAMTIEAWVYPEEYPGDPACQAIVDHQLGASYWFG